MLVEKNNIKKYIPQREPFIMVDNLIEMGEDTIVSDFNVSSDNPMIKNGFFSESGMIENIAQTAAVGVGYEAEQNNEKVKKGFLGAVKNLKTFDLAKSGDTLKTKVKIISKIMNATVIHGIIELSGKKILECEMSFFLQD